jgi:hypothetical protein
VVTLLLHRRVDSSTLRSSRCPRGCGGRSSGGGGAPSRSLAVAGPVFHPARPTLKLNGYGPGIYRSLLGKPFLAVSSCTSCSGVRTGSGGSTGSGGGAGGSSIRGRRPVNLSSQARSPVTAGRLYDRGYPKSTRERPTTGGPLAAGAEPLQTTRANPVRTPPSAGPNQPRAKLTAWVRCPRNRGTPRVTRAARRARTRRVRSLRLDELPTERSDCGGVQGPVESAGGSAPRGGVGFVTGGGSPRTR